MFNQNPLKLLFQWFSYSINLNSGISMPEQWIRKKKNPQLHTMYLPWQPRHHVMHMLVWRQRASRALKQTHTSLLGPMWLCLQSAAFAKEMCNINWWTLGYSHSCNSTLSFDLFTHLLSFSSSLLPSLTFACLRLGMQSLKVYLLS